jgi:hypothetical protein
VIVMKNYEIHKNKIGDYPFVIFSTSYVSPIENIMDIEQELGFHFKGKVLFDLLLSNGVSSNRFVEADYDGEKFDYSSFKTLNQVGLEIKKESSEFYRTHTEFLTNSILPNAHQFLIKKGKLI